MEASLLLLLGCWSPGAVVAEPDGFSLGELPASETQLASQAWSEGTKGGGFELRRVSRASIRLSVNSALSRGELAPSERCHLREAVGPVGIEVRSVQVTDAGGVDAAIVVFGLGQDGVVGTVRTRFQASVQDRAMELQMVGDLCDGLVEAGLADPVVESGRVVIGNADWIIRLSDDVELRSGPLHSESTSFPLQQCTRGACVEIPGASILADATSWEIVDGAGGTVMVLSWTTGTGGLADDGRRFEMASASTEHHPLHPMFSDRQLERRYGSLPVLEQQGRMIDEAGGEGWTYAGGLMLIDGRIWPGRWEPAAVDCRPDGAVFFGLVGPAGGAAPAITADAVAGGWVSGASLPCVDEGLASGVQFNGFWLVEDRRDAHSPQYPQAQSLLSEVSEPVDCQTYGLQLASGSGSFCVPMHWSIVSRKEYLDFRVYELEQGALLSDLSAWEEEDLVRLREELRVLRNRVVRYFL